MDSIYITNNITNPQMPMVNVFAVTIPKISANAITKYTKLKIVDFDGQPRLKQIPANNKQGFIVVQDASMPNMYDFIVRLEDTAKKTPDGYVAGGNKIKMGIPVVMDKKNKQQKAFMEIARRIKGESIPITEISKKRFRG